LGSVNAGKSSLFNALIGTNRAIVTNIPGTTRDVIEAGLYSNDTYQTIIDTAGLRETNNSIEKEGITRSFAQAHKADIILLVYDGSKQLSNAEQKIYRTILDRYAQKIIVVRNKSDLKQVDTRFFTHQASIPLSCKDKKNIHLIQNEIDKKIQTLFAQLNSPFLLNQRQFNLLADLEQKLKKILAMLNDAPAYELISIHLQDALVQLSAFSGKTISERCMDELFKTFCIGK